MIETLERISARPKKDVVNFIDYVRSKDRAIYDDRGICFYLKLNNLMLRRVREDKNYIINNILFLLTCKGDNLHFFGLVLDKAVGIRREIKLAIKKENPKSISWWDKTMDKFIYREIKQCRQ